MSTDGRPPQPPAEASPPPSSGSWVSSEPGSVGPRRTGPSPVAVIGTVAVAVAAVVAAGLLLWNALSPSVETADDGAGTAEAPVFDDQIDAASDQAAWSDARSLAVAIMQWSVENPDKSLPTVTDDGTHFLLDGQEYAGVSAGTSIGGLTGTGPDDFCVWVISASGSAFEARSNGAHGAGTCE